MRPLFHPSIEDVTVEAILHALSDPVRVAIFVEIVGSDCPRNCSNFLQVRERDIPKSTLSQHFNALREAGLIHSERRGVEMHNISRCAEVDKRFPGLLAAIVNGYRTQQQAKQQTTKRKKAETSQSPRDKAKRSRTKVQS